MTKNEVTTDVSITIEEQPYLEMMQYAHEFSPDECSGCGLVERIDYDDGSVTFNVTKVFLPLQSNTPGTTDIHEDELNKLNTQLVIDGEDTSLLRFHWHSHVDMSVFHSGTDDSNYDDMKLGDYAISLVVNKKYDMLGSVHLYEPLRINVLNIDVEAPDIDLDEYKMSKELRKMIEANVKRVKDAEEEERKKNLANRVVYTYAKPYRDPWADECQSFGNGLAQCDALYSLLVQGEKAGLITLMYDDDKKTINGYINLHTQECFELTSYLDYARY